MKFELDKFNSEIFEIRMANILSDEESLSKDDVAGLIENGKTEGYDCLSIKLDTAEKKQLSSFLANGFELVDTLITYFIPVTENRYFPENPRLAIRKVSESDIDDVMRIARSAFKIDQFHSDSNLDSDKADTYYEQWAKNSCNGFADDVFLVEETESRQPAGFITINYSEEKATVGLAAIDSAFHGKGVFTFLIAELIRIVKEKNIKYISYGTQLANIAVLRTMAKFNGVPQNSKHILHKMI